MGFQRAETGTSRHQGSRTCREEASPFCPTALAAQRGFDAGREGKQAISEGTRASEERGRGQGGRGFETQSRQRMDVVDYSDW